MGFTAAVDLKTLWTANFDKTNVTGPPALTDKPNIRLLGDTEPDGLKVNGEVIIGVDRLAPSIWSTDFRRERSVLEVEVKLQNNEETPTSTTLMELVKELATVNRTNNKSISRVYYIDLAYTWPGQYYRGEVNLLVVMVKDLVG